MVRSIVLALAIVLGHLFQLPPPTVAYGFKNCIENPFNRYSFNCLHRQQRNISALVADLPDWATSLNISHNQVSHIPPGSFSHLQQLKTLKLDWNYLQNVSNYAFLNLGQLESLNLSTNKIKTLEPLAFSGLENLTELILSSNALWDFPPQVFSNLTNLNFLNFQINRLSNFSRIMESVTHLHKLMKLDLCNNQLTSLHHSSSLPPSLAILYLCSNRLATLACKDTFLSSVHLLDLSYNGQLKSNSLRGLDMRNISYMRLRFTQVSATDLFSFSNVNPGHVDFSGMGLQNSSKVMELCKLLKSKKCNMHRLILQDNNISNLKDATFSNCPLIMETFDLSHNRLKSAGCLRFLKGQNHLVKIILEHNVLSHLESCRSQQSMSFPNLATLSYRYNRILDVKSFAFSHTPNLTTLNLNINSIAYLDRKALKGLRRLTTLRLDNNLLTDIYKESFSDLHRLRTLNLRENRIAVIFNETFHALGCLQILDLGGNKISKFQQNAFAGLHSLANLYLDGNHLKQIDGWHFERLRATLRVLDLQGNRIRYLYNYSDSPFVNLSHLQDLKLDGQMPYGITLLPNGFFRGLKSLRSLRLGNNRIYYLQPDIFDDLTSLEFLSLDNSCDGVTQLQPGIFKNQRKLRRLNAENMGIQSLTADVFGNLTQLQVLMLTHNAMQTVDQTLLENLTSLRYLDLRHIPISCTCPNSWFQNWTNNNPKVQLVYHYSLMCPDHPGAYFYNFDTKVCYLDVGGYLFAFTSNLIFLLSVLPLLYAKLYWNLKYSYYVFRSWFGERWRRLREEEEQCKYDAFISYNSADEKWVLEQLLPNLEGGGSPFRLCLHHRDFELGRDIVDNIVAAVYGSRKTVCVVSQRYLRSEWCSLEIQLASYRLFHELRDVLLLVFLEPIPDRQLSAYHRMRKVMLNKTYLQWPGADCSDPTQAQELFWTKLRRALRSSNISHSEEVEEEKAEREESEPFVDQIALDDETCYLKP
ncbi:toll-like receptor 21 [Megalops cyprinoides]|uniref:toll-like receptor 21 n=1 Tax=Megalops cyprinoides TaxID=118141 RepID=UPI001863BA4E|nr:toll-like receptor 21 [Megalops cyprinoides]